MTWLKRFLDKVAAFKHCDGGARDWCAKLREMQIFANLSENSVNEMCARMEPVRVEAGEVIIREGQEGDYYYVIVDGKAVVTRAADRREVESNGDEDDIRHEIKVADLDTGDGFGEEALISQAKRNATVTMMTAGVLMRLAKSDFEELLKEPQLKWMGPTAAAERVREGARWLDVRGLHGTDTGSLPGALRIPVEELRDKVDTLDKETLYICYCDHARLSATAAFLLSQMGYQVAVLQGGLSAVM